jgi:serine/threonine-protein kinase
MITYEGDVKIIDLGLARTNLGEFRTAPGMVLGTLRYMSPEQAVAEPVDRRSDLYSWSVVLYEMLSGRPLVTGVNAQEILHAVVTRIPPPLSHLNSNLPKALDAVLERGMAKEREDRFGSAKEMADAIRAAAPELCKTKQSKIGRFVASVFPDARLDMDELRHPDEGPGYEPTRAGQNELTAANVPMPVAEPPQSESSGELTPEHFAPTNVFVAPTSMYSVSVPEIPRRQRTTLWMVVLATAAVVAVVTAIVVLPKAPATAVQPISVAPSASVAPPAPADPVVSVSAKPEDPPPAPPPKPKAPPQKLRPAEPVRKEPPPAPVERKKVAPARRPWEEKVDALTRQGRLSDALKVMETRARAIGDDDAARCAYDGMTFARQADVAKCAEILREAEQKR